MAKKKLDYSEPSSYFPKELRKKYQLGEFAPEEEKATKKKTSTKKK